MAQTLKDVMTSDPIILPASATVAEAAKKMRDSDIGDVLVQDDAGVAIVTDRDITIRVVAEGKDPSSTTVGDCSSKDIVTLAPDASVEEAVKLMRDKAIRRLPVVEGGKAVGIVSLGDLAMEKDPNSALADISEAPPSD